MGRQAHGAAILPGMNGLALAMVLLSAVAHASWNYLMKGALRPEVFSWWLLASISVLLLPLGAVLAWQTSVESPGWWYVLGTVALHAFYFLFLGRGYTHGDLSLVYPIARGIGPMAVPVMAVIILDETVSALAVGGITAVVIGIYTVYWWGNISAIVRDPLRFLKDPGARYAVLTGVVIAVYSVWDKVGVRYVNPLLYMYLMSLGTVLSLMPYMVRAHGLDGIAGEFRAGPLRIAAAGLLTFLAYGLVLSALDFSRVSYISPAREVGIVIGVVLGAALLKEPLARGRMLGSGSIVIGLVLIAVAP